MGRVWLEAATLATMWNVRQNGPNRVQSVSVTAVATVSVTRNVLVGCGTIG